jgi:hypothetical protein
VNLRPSRIERRLVRQECRAAANLARAAFPASPAELLPDNDRLIDRFEIYLSPKDRQALAVSIAERIGAK